MIVQERIEAFLKLGAELKKLLLEDPSKYQDHFIDVVEKAYQFNNWFTEENVKASVRGFVEMLKVEEIENWLSNYKMTDPTPKTIGLIMAGNIPMVGFHDVLCVLLSGHKCLIKHSSQDQHLLPFIYDILCDVEPRFKNRLFFTESVMKDIDGIIATGSNNSSRYFEYYFGKYPHVIRKNRNAVAVLRGDETKEDFENIGQDIFQYFGLGCRNVSKVFVPEGYDFDFFFRSIEKYAHLIDHPKYRNNYEYQRSIYLVNQQGHLDNGFVLLRNEESLSSPVGVLYTQCYSNTDELISLLDSQKEMIQCVVAPDGMLNDGIGFGQAQKPKVWQYADGVDTLDFLLGLN